MADRTANASDVGLVVQGTLIFLSAIVAVLGYVIQNRLHDKAKERQLARERTEKHKEARLARLRKMLHDIIGPMSGLAQQGQQMMI